MDAIRKGLRQIMKVKTTYGQKVANMEPTNTNDNLIQLVNSKINTFQERKIIEEGEEEQEHNPFITHKFRKEKQIIWMSE